MHRSSMSRWRKRLGEKGEELLLKETIESALHLGALRRVDVAKVYVDRGYKGHGCSPDIVPIDKKRRGRTPMSFWKKLKRRACIEPVIGHLKSQHRMERN